MRVSYHRKAQEEVIEISQFFEGQTPGLGEKFLDSFDDAIERIRCWPQSFGIVRGRIRCASIPPFQYGIHYRILSDRIRVLVVKHHARDPDYGMRR